MTTYRTMQSELRNSIRSLKRKQHTDDSAAQLARWNAEKAVTDESRSRCLNAAAEYEARAANRQRQISAIEARLERVTA